MAPLTTTGNFELLRRRLARLEYFVFISALVWGCYGIYSYCVGHQISNCLCLLATCASICLLFGVKKSLRSRKVVANCLIGVGLATVVLISVVQGHSLSYAFIISPFICFVAGYLLGIRVAILWAGIFTAFTCAIYSLEIPFHSFEDPSTVDKFVVNVGLTITLFLLSHQAENFLARCTDSMVTFSKSFQDRTSLFERLANYDSLTGVANRYKFENALDRTVELANQNETRFGLFALDLDGFKYINDALGHCTGDRVLSETAKRLKEVVGPNNLVSRLGGDEFTVIIKDLGTEEEAIEWGEKLVESISAPYLFEDQELSMGVSVGAVLFPEHASVRTDLFTSAGLAMHSAKQKGNRFTLYRKEMTESLQRKRFLEERLSTALDSGEFRLVYQPQVDNRSGEIVSFEALMRWDHEGSNISPFEFIPLLEESGQIVEVGQWVLREACRQVEVWRGMGYEVNMGVNVSALQFRDPDFVTKVKAIINDFDIDPKWIDLEITESLLVEEIEVVTSKLFELKKFGTMFSVDDFGTGYSSLAYLKHFPIDRLKIDRTFIKDIPEHDDGTIAACIIVLAQSLDLEVIAEGVETEAQLNFISEHCCDMFQGYYTSPPLEADKCIEFIDGQESSTSPKTTNSPTQSNV